MKIRHDPTDDCFVVTVELSPATVQICREIFPPAIVDLAIANLAVVAHGCASDSDSREIQAQITARLRKARSATLKARELLSKFVGIEGATMKPAIQQLDTVAASLLAKIQIRTSKGRKPAINKRYALHAVTGLFRRHNVAVTINDSPASDFVRLCQSLFADIGIGGGVDSIADAARKARVLRQGEPGEVWTYESGGAGMMLGLGGGGPTMFNFNSQSYCQMLSSGAFRLEVRYMPVPAQTPNQ